MKLNVSQIHHQISNILREYSIEESQFANKQATAIAYVNLLLEDPEFITDRHIKMLQKEFDSRQIMEITHYVLDQIGENAYVNAFRLRCSRVLQAETSVKA